MTECDNRQSFLGENSATIFATTVVGIVGLGGGGSHVVQQLAHIGFKRFVIVDPDQVEVSNLNRLVGATVEDAELKTPKVRVASKMILQLQPDAQIAEKQTFWQEDSDALLDCDLIVGAVDAVTVKSELEQFCRRFHIPYFDMGMDVHELPDQSHLVAGQVVRSVVGGPCLRCLGIVTDSALKTEADNYGAAGGLPQVIWPNGVLASTVVGMIVHMLTPWSSEDAHVACVEYDANRNIMCPSPKLRVLANSNCQHFLDNEIGDPLFDIRDVVKVATESAAQPSMSRFLSWVLKKIRIFN